MNADLRGFKYEDYKKHFNFLKMKDNLKYITVECPSCGKFEGYIKLGSDFLNCNRRNKCGANINLIKLYSNYNNISYLEAKKILTGDTNLKISPKSNLEIIVDNLKLNLENSPNVIDYLKKRNITLEEAKRMKFGSLNKNNKEKIIELVKKYYEEKKMEFPQYINNIKEEYSLALPIMRNTKIHGILLRDIKNINKAKYINLVTFPKDFLYGEMKKKSNITFIFEGVIDSSIVSILTDYNVKYESGVTCDYELEDNYILSYDNDLVGQKKIYKIISEKIEECNKKNIGVLIYPNEKKDIMDIIEGEGIFLNEKSKKNKINKALKNIIPFSQFLAENYLINDNLVYMNSIANENEWFKMLIINEYKKYYEKMNDVYKINFVYHLSKNLNLEEDYLKKIFILN